MGIADWFSWITRAPAAAATVPEPSATFSVDLATPVDDYITSQQVDTTLEAPITKQQALTVDAVLRGRNLLCSFATLPLEMRNKAGKRVESRLLDQFDRNTANVVVLAGTIEDLVFEGYAWWRCTEWDANGFPVSAEKLDAYTVSMTPPADHAKGLRTLPSEQKLPVGTVWVEGVPTAVRDPLGRPVLIRFDSPNPGVLKAAARSIRRLLMLQRAGIKYADNTRAQEYFVPDPNADPLEDDEIVDLLNAWKLARQQRTTGFVPGSVELKQVDVMSPVELQLIDILRDAIVGVANAMGLDPEDFGVSTTSRTYQNGVDRRQDRINDVFSPYMSAIKDRLSMNDVCPRGQKVSFVLDDYMKADPKTRWECYEIGIRIGALSIAEVREMENLDPSPELERAAKQKAAQADADASDELAERRRKVVAGAPVRAAFSKAADPEVDGTHTTLTFSLDDEDREEFSADLEKRTITGLMLPWNKVAANGSGRWRFRKGSLTWGDPSRVKLNLDHNRTAAVGYAQKIWSTSRGLMATFKITTHASGDEALVLASDKVKDGFSIEADFARDGWELVEVGGDYVRDVHKGQLSGCALTAAPAFDDARLTSVRASREGKGGPMDPKDEKDGGGVGTLELSAEASAAFAKVVADAMEGQSEQFNALLQQLIDAQQKPENVDPAGGGRRKAQFEVTEEPLYRFDGGKGQHDFSSDIIAGSKGNDGDALKRATEFMTEAFAEREKAKFAITTGNVASLNPNINRPDLYVDQLTYQTPIWDAIRKGTIDDNTPFVLPKFNASSGLVGDHTQGVEPTPGALTTTSQTITPSAVSGKVEVTREAWDQGGNPQLSTIIWRQMLRAWDEALEQGAAALLEAQTVTTFTLTDGAVDKALAKEIKSALASLHFIRGGFRFRDFVLESGLYRAAANAVDDTGRPLFPVLAPQNADGQMSELFAALNLGGLAGKPSWALPYTAGAENDSYLFNREDVHGWASAPRRLDFEYRVAFVDIALWGYKAFAVTRTDGIRKFAYDETA